MPSTAFLWRAMSASPGAWRRFQESFAKRFEELVQHRYRPLLRQALRWRYFTVAVALALLLVTIGFVAGGHIRFSFFPPIEAENVAAHLTMPQGTSPEATARALRAVEESAFALHRQLEEEGSPDAFRHVLTSVGDQP